MEELKQICQVLDYEVMPVMEAFGVPITREELSGIFEEWFVAKKTGSSPEFQSSPTLGYGQAVAAAAPTSGQGRMSPATGPFHFPLHVASMVGPLRKVAKGVGVAIMLAPIFLIPAYFFISTLSAPPLALGFGASQSVGFAPSSSVGPLSKVNFTLTPASPLLAPGQTQNYSFLSVGPGDSTTPPLNLTVSSPQGLSVELSESYVVSQQARTTIPLVIHASAQLAPGSYPVMLEEKGASSSLTQTFTIVVVPAFVVMKNLAFVPQSLDVAPGTTVYWMNLDSTIGCCDPGYHNVVFDGAGMNVSSPILTRLGTWSFTFESPGDYYYMCSIHPFMAAEVTVSG